MYSGLQNITLRGVPNATQILTIDLAKDPGTWDTLQLEIADDPMPGSIGITTIHPGAEVALASAPGDFPFVTRLGDGDPYPSGAILGSGSKFLWVGTSAPDGDFFAATQFGTFGTGQAYSGWIHFIVQNTSTSSASMTVIDWAYSDVIGETIAMGQIPVPEPSSLALLLSSLLSGMVFPFTRRQCPKPTGRQSVEEVTPPRRRRAVTSSAAL
jgi:hypothetical protein